MSLIPTDADMLVLCLGAALIGLVTKSAERLAIVCVAVIALHIALVVLLPYFDYPHQLRLGAIVILLIGTYVEFLAAAFVGYGIRLIALRLFKRAA